MTRIIALFVILIFSSCIVVPKKEMVFDEGCGVMVKHMTLETEVLGEMGHCDTEECLVLLVGVAAIGATSVVISGSIAIVANIIYWFEKEARCQ